MINYFKISVYTGDEYETFFIQSTEESKTAALYEEIRKEIKRLYGSVERIIYVGKA